MSLRAALIVGVLAASAAASASAQVPPAPVDPIDALLREKPVDPDEPDAESVEPPGAQTGAPQAYAAPPRPNEPVFLHETGKAPDGPPTASDQAYDARLRVSAAAVRGFQGPMEGGWTLSAGGRDVYALQLVDRGGWVDGAWRDLRRPGALQGSGFIEGVQRTGGDLTFRLGPDVVALLHPRAGGWVGELSEGGRTQPVTLSRRGP